MKKISLTKYTDFIVEKTTELLNIKFYLEKYANIQNIEKYTLRRVYEMYEIYKKYLSDNKGQDIAFPNFTIKLN